MAQEGSNIDLESQLRYAAAAGMAKIKKPGTELPSREEVEECMGQIEFRDYKELVHSPRKT